MRWKHVSAFVLAVLIVSSMVPTVVSAQISLLLHVRKHYDATWYFYDNRVEVSAGSEKIVLETILADSRLSRYFNMEFAHNGTHVVYTYSLTVEILGKTYTITVVNIFIFAQTPYVKLRTVIRSSAELPPIVGYFFSYNITCYFSEVRETNSTIEGRVLSFSWKDMVEHGIDFVKESSSLNSFYLKVDLSLRKELTIDPTVGYSEGETETQYFRDVSEYELNVSAETSNHDEAVDDEWFGGTFKLSKNLLVKAVKAYVQRMSGFEQPLYVYIYEWDEASSTIGDLVANVTVPYSEVSTSASWHTFEFPEAALLLANKTYAVFFHTVGGSAQTSEYYKMFWIDSDTYPNGYMVISQDNGNTFVTYSSYDLSHVAIMVSEAEVSEGHYWAYSDSNVTYAYHVVNEVNRTIYLLIGKGVDVLNVTRSDGTSVTYETLSYNETHYAVKFYSASGYNYTVYGHAWNAVYDLTVNHSYYPYGSAITVYATLKDPYGNPLSQNITFWAGISQYPYETVLKETITITNGLALAPHLYNWYMDGENDYVHLPDTVDKLHLTTFTLEALFKFTYSDVNPRMIISKQKAATGDYRLAVKNYRLHVGIYNGTAHEYDSYAVLEENTWYHGVATYDGTLKIYVNGKLDRQVGIGVTPANSGTDAYIGAYAYNPTSTSYLFKGFVGFVRIYNRTISETEIGDSYSNHVVNATQMVLFLDPTFYNGTHYIDLSPYGNNGTPYNGVARVEADEKWIWKINGLYSDDKVHLLWFPVGSIVKFKDSNGNVVREVFISSNHEAVSLPEGNYTVEVKITYGDYSEEVKTADSNGEASWTLTAPSYDAYVIIQAETEGDYVGVKNVTAKVTKVGSSVSIPLASDERADVGEEVYATITLWYTVDSAKFSGKATVNGVNYTVADGSLKYLVTSDVPALKWVNVSKAYSWTSWNTSSSGSIVFDQPEICEIYFLANGSLHVKLRSKYDGSEIGFLKNETMSEALLYSLTYGLNNITIPKHPYLVNIYTVTAVSENNRTVEFVSSGNYRLKLNVTGPDVLHVHCGELGKPRYVTVDGEIWTQWTYFDERKEAQITIPGTLVEIIWYQPGTAGGGGGGGAAYPSKPSVGEVVTYPYVKVPSQGVAIIAALVAAAAIIANIRTKPKGAKGLRFDVSKLDRKIRKKLRQLGGGR